MAMKEKVISSSWKEKWEAWDLPLVSGLEVSLNHSSS